MTETLPKIASLHPFAIKVEKDRKYSWCSCGLTKTEPFCDGSHKSFKDNEGNSIMKSLKIECDADKTVYFCGCKHTKTPPFCDGTHSSL